MQNPPTISANGAREPRWAVRRGGGVGEVVSSVKRDIRIGGSPKRKGKGQSYKGVGNKCPLNSSDVDSQAHHFRRDDARAS